jgi:ABC-2 type transport system permease protein
MNTLDARELDIDSTRVARRSNDATRPLLWSIRREFWENRFLYVAPLVVTAFVLLGTLIMIVTAASRNPDPVRHYASIVKAFRMAPAPIMLASFIIAVFYCLDALYGERRDRSILFWKSLPVSDRTTVLAKALVPLAVLPAFALMLCIATQAVLLVAATVTAPLTGVSPFALWGRIGFIEGLPIMAYGLIVHALWFAPIYGWCLLVSAWTKRAPLIWAFVPPMVIAMFERMAGGKAFAGLLKYRVTGAMQVAFDFTNSQPGHVDRVRQLTPGTFLATPGLWMGLLFTAACIATAIRVRRRREPI